MRTTIGLITVGVMVLGLTAFAPGGGNLDNIRFSDGTVCGLIGTAHSSAGQALSRLKNRYKIPSPANIQPSVTLAAMLQPGRDETRFQPSSAATITGFVNDVKLGGTQEVCNCGHRLPEDRDTHIEISLSPTALPTERVIVEVTPRLRQIMMQQGVDWSTQTLERQGPSHPDGIKGKWIEATGWMMFDSMHVNEAENTNPGNSANWRATCWELHPVTSIRVLAGPPPAPSGHPNMTAFSATVARARTAHRAALSPAAKRQYQRRNARILARFPATERENDYQ